MASTINAKSSGAGGLDYTGDASGVLGLQTGGTTAVTIDTSQNVGIGTTSPAYGLHVSGTGTKSYLRITNTTGTYNAKFNVEDTGETTIGSWSNNPLMLLTNNTERMRIDSSGNVGIGTSSPGWRLDVAQNAAGTYISSGITNLSSTGSARLLFNIGSSAGANGQADVSYAPGIFFTMGPSVNDTTTPIVFRNNNATERMRIDSSGYVRVNNTTGIDGQFSSVAGAWYAGAFANTDINYPVTYNWSRANSGNNLFMTFYTENPGAIARGTIDYNRAGNAVRYNTSSDERLKENIVDAPSAIDLINSVKIRSFDWKETGFHVDYGVIAQELNEVVPDAVSEGLDNEDGTIKQAWGVDTSVLVPALVKAIQEQQTIINDLKARIETLEAK